MSAVRNIVIVGGGYSGALTAVHLLRSAEARRLRVVIIERRRRIARGLAYHTGDDNTLLNVPAGNMSALADEPGHFVDYLQAIDPAYGPGAFVSRRVYGDYLEDLLALWDRKAEGVLQRIHGNATSVTPDSIPGKWLVRLKDGGVLVADDVVLAPGHFAPFDLPAVAPIRTSRAYIANPWDTAAIDRCDPVRPVVILGSGHTAIDVLFRLTSASDTRPVLLISRHGLLPHGHRMPARAPAPAAAGIQPQFLADVQPTLRAITQAVIREARRQGAQGRDWRDTINALRPHTVAIWEQLGTADRRRFLRVVAPFWDIHRHRLAPIARRHVERLLQSGQLRHIAARLESCASAGEEVRLTVRRRGCADSETLTVGTVISCTGPAYDIHRIRDPLLAQLRDDGLIRRDPQQLGFDVDADYRVVRRDGNVADGLHYVGPMLKARYWEAIAVPELRQHTQRLAQHLLQRVHRRPELRAQVAVDG